jgi:tetratricopeptide (TPR) repeat protein
VFWYWAFGFSHTASLAENDDPEALNKQVDQLIEQGRYQEAIPIAQRAIEAAKRARGSEQAETATAVNNLGLLFKRIGDYAKAEPLYQEALRIRQKVLGPENSDTALSLNNLGLLTSLDVNMPAGRFFRKRSGFKKVLAQNTPTATSFDNSAHCTGLWARPPGRRSCKRPSGSGKKILALTS